MVGLGAGLFIFFGEKTREDNQPSPSICSNILLPTSSFPPKRHPVLTLCVYEFVVAQHSSLFQKVPFKLGFANSLVFCSLHMSFKNNQPVDEQSLWDLQLVTKTQFL